MVEVIEITEEEETTTKTVEVAPVQTLPPSEERTLDADEIESLCQKYASRPSVKAHLTSLVQKIRRDAQALKRMEASQKKMQDEEKSKMDVEVDVDANNGEEEEKVVVEEVETKPASKPAASASIASSKSAPPPKSTPSQKYKSIDKFAFDAGSYNSPTVTIYITNLPNINQLPRENITCDFTPTSFDLKISDYNGCHYRLLKNNLDKDINPEKSKIIIKSSKIIIKLGKVKGEYGSYESWMDLTSKKGKESKVKAKSDPSAGIMDMMKEMYDSGDDQMKKMIGETMLKQREGKLDGPKGMGDMGDMGNM